MARHGCLCRKLIPSGAIASMLGWICALTFSVATAEETNAVDIRVQLEWRAKEACYWKTQVEVANDESSVIDEVADIGESDLSGTMDQPQGPTGLLIQPRFPQATGKIEFRVRGQRDAKLLIRSSRFEPKENSTIQHLPPREISLGELVETGELLSDENHAENSDTPSWSLTRVETDGLRMEGLSSGMTVSPGQALSYTIQCNSLLPHASKQLTLHSSLIRVQDGKTSSASRQIVRIDPSGNSQPMEVSIQAPKTPGVYEVRTLLVQEDENIWSRIRRRDITLMQMGQPLIVRGPVHSFDTEAWRRVGEIRAMESSWSVSQWIPPSRFIPGSEPTTEPPPLPNKEFQGETVSLLSPNQSFQSILPVLGRSRPHRITLRLAQDRAIRLNVQLKHRSQPAGTFTISQDAVADPNKPWLEYSWVHHPNAEPSISITNLGSETAAIESIAIDAGPTRLGTRRAGSTGLGSDEAAFDKGSDEFVPNSSITYESANQPRHEAILCISREDWVALWSFNPVTGRRDFDDSTLFAHRAWTASHRLADYAREQSFSGVMLPADGANAASDAFQIAKRIDATKLALSIFEHEQLRVYVSLQPKRLIRELESSLRLQPRLAEPLTRDEQGHSELYQLLDPNVQRVLASFIGEQDSLYADFASYAGLGLVCARGNHLQLPIAAEREASVLARFAESQNLSATALENPDWFTQQDRAVFDHWFESQVTQAYNTVTQSLLERPAILLVPADELSPWMDASHRGWTFAPILQFGDSQVLQDQGQLQKQLARLSAKEIKPPATLMVRSTDQMDNSHQTHPAWQVELSRLIDAFQPTRVLIHDDVVGSQLNDEQSQLLAAFTSLPPAPFEVVQGPDPASQTVRVRSAFAEGRLWVSVASQVPWPTDLDLETSRPATWSENSFAKLQQRSQTRIRLTVPPGQMVVLSAESKDSEAVRLLGWTSRVSGGIDTLQQIKQQVTSVVERIAQLSELKPIDQPRNGDFEQSGNMGLVGWLHAQYPPGCVQVDDQHFANGKQSIVLTTDPKTSNRTWIVSETMSPPTSGRLAVSLSCRSESQENAMPHRLKVSIEATREGRPIRFTKEVEVPRTGRWVTQQAVLEADGIQPGEVDSLRLTIDSLSVGRIWIDDVQLHSRFATQQEREELQSLAFLAVQGLQRGNLAPAGRLLQNPWARHVLSLKQVKQPAPVTQVEPPPEEPPGVAERIRTWLPRPLRF